MDTDTNLISPLPETHKEYRLDQKRSVRQHAHFYPIVRLVALGLSGMGTGKGKFGPQTKRNRIVV